MFRKSDLRETLKTALDEAWLTVVVCTVVPGVMSGVVTCVTIDLAVGIITGVADGVNDDITVASLTVSSDSGTLSMLSSVFGVAGHFLILVD